MIVIGADPHKRTHTLVAVDAATGEQRSCETVKATAAGSEVALGWARELGGERVWAVEDCRHVSGRLEGALIVAGERVVRVAPKLMAGARRGSRERGKSDPIDALAVARAALGEGVKNLPVAVLEGASLDLGLLLDHPTTWLRSALTSSAVCVGICTRWGLATTFPRGRWIARSGSIASGAAWAASPRPPGS